MSEPQYDTEDMAQIGIYDSLRTEIERLRGRPPSGLWFWECDSYFWNGSVWFCCPQYPAIRALKDRR